MLNPQDNGQYPVNPCLCNTLVLNGVGVGRCKFTCNLAKTWINSQSNTVHKESEDKFEIHIWRIREEVLELCHKYPSNQKLDSIGLTAGKWLRTNYGFIHYKKGNKERAT